LNKNTLALIAAGAGLVACAGGWLALLALQSPRRVVASEVSVELERARRLLDRYNVMLAQQSLLVGQLEENGIEVGEEGLPSELEDEYQQLHAEMWEAYRPTDWAEGSPEPRPARANYGNLPRQIEQGLARQAASMDGNERLLADAMQAVERALSVTDGDESSRTHAEANRLKATILHHMGLGKWAEAQLRRQEADRFRQTLLALANRARESKSMTTLVADSRIDERIATLQEEEATLEAELAEERRALATLDERLEDLETQWESARSRRAEALAALDACKAKGVDFSDPEGGERFRIRMEELDAAFRAADREVRSLEHGDYLNAQIDRSGDFLNGRYVKVGSVKDPAFEQGVMHFRGEHAVASKQVEGKERVLRAVQADTQLLEGMKAEYTEIQARAADRINECATAATEAYEELSLVESEAFAIEDEALEILERSGKASQQAAGYARQWISDALDRTEGLSSEVKERSAFGSRLQDTWMGGYIAAQEADVRLAKAWIYYERYASATQNSRILSVVTDALPLREVDAESERAKRAEAHDAGAEEIAQAVKLLERVHNDTNRHWTVAAQAAGATYLMALFGHEDYVADAIEGYRNAVKGRENEKSAATFVARLNRLESGGDQRDEEPAPSAPPTTAEP